MIYLVRVNKKITECYSWSQVKKILLKACADWVNDKNYIPSNGCETAQELFELGISKQDFGDVAQVFRLTAPEDEEKGFYFNYCNPQDTFIGERIF